MNDEFTVILGEFEELEDERPEDVYAFIKEAYKRQLNLQQQS
ncbi:hypothetical protein NST41_14185 [Paenibacillus sp. FSL L8-0696]